MKIESLEIKSFRNYRDFKVEFAPHINILYGKNGQGKTNLLEAIYICTCGRSHRTSKDADLINFSDDFYDIKVNFATKNSVNSQNSYQENLRIRYSQIDEYKRRLDRAKRTIYHDGIELAKISELMGIFHAVIFAPEDLQILRDGPAARRRFIDLLIAQTDRLYFTNLQRMNSIHLQKNKVLKQNGLDAKWQTFLDIYDTSLATIYSEIVCKRQSVCAEIAELANHYYEKISGGREKIDINYASSLINLTHSELNSLPKTEFIELIYQRLLKNRADDCQRGSSNFGPHRDDLNILFNGKIAKSVASQGQIRSIVLALKLAELKWLEKATKEKPILLLDDVMSELDSERRLALIEAIEDLQVFITCTEPKLIANCFANKNLKINYLPLENGKILTNQLTAIPGYSF